MSVRVIARIRPLLKLELDKDVIVTAAPSGAESAGSPTVVRIPNPKNETEQFSFQFNSVYEQQSTQQEVFDKEIAPTVKHLYNGFDVTIFAYGVTGTGKTHTMRGGKSLADRGVIPRLLSGVYRRAKKVEKDSNQERSVEVSMSYYEIYNDRVYDLFEPPEKRSAAGLPIRDNNGKTVVVGLTERPCGTLRDFEHLYDQANINRSTSATKLNAHSSRSHAILCVKLTQNFGDRTLVSTASAIDLAGSEDNRRTDNNKDRLVESASINKSLFVLAQCVEAIGKKQSRIPYRESKMTRILSLGQNNGLMIMILNLAPLRSYHLDTLSSLNFANRTKKIEIRDVENEPVFCGGTGKATVSFTGQGLQRQPLRALAIANNIQPAEPVKAGNKTTRAFSVFADKARMSNQGLATPAQLMKSAALKRTADVSYTATAKATKSMRYTGTLPSASAEKGLSKAEIEALIEQRVDQRMAEKALSNAIEPAQALSSDLQKRLNALEQRVAEKEDSDGLQYLLMGRQHQARGEESSALKMYRLAEPFFPANEKLARKIASLEKTISQRKVSGNHGAGFSVFNDRVQKYSRHENNDDSSYEEPMSKSDSEEEVDVRVGLHTKARKPLRQHIPVFRDQADRRREPLSPRTLNLLQIINSRDITQIKALKGVGAKKAEAIVGSLFDMEDDENRASITDLEQLGALKGVGAKTVENMRLGLILEGAS